METWEKIRQWREKSVKFSILELATLMPTKLIKVPRAKSSNLNMVLQTYGLSISSEDESIENRLIDDNDVIISDRKSVNYSDNMLAMSPFAGDYPPTANYINYTDLDASYQTQGKISFSKKHPFPVRCIADDAQWIDISARFIVSLFTSMVHSCTHILKRWNLIWIQCHRMLSSFVISAALQIRTRARRINAMKF